MGLVAIVQEKVDRHIDRWVKSRAWKDLHAGKELSDATLDLIRNSRKEIYIVSGKNGKFDPTLDNEEFASILADKLNDPRDYKAHILLHKSSSHPQTLQKLKRQSPDFRAILTNPNCERRLAVYWASGRPLYRFIISDDVVLLERSAESTASCDATVFHHAPEIAAEYRRYFKKLVKYRGIVHKLYPPALN